MRHEWQWSKLQIKRNDENVYCTTKQLYVYMQLKSCTVLCIYTGRVGHAGQRRQTPGWIWLASRTINQPIHQITPLIAACRLSSPPSCYSNQTCIRLDLLVQYTYEIAYCSLHSTRLDSSAELETMTSMTLYYNHFERRRLSPHFISSRLISSHQSSLTSRV
jgi:hypothetical protein